MRNIEKFLDEYSFVTDGGIETTFIFENEIDLPHFAAFPMVEDPLQKKILWDYYVPYLELAKKHQKGFILESATYKASSETGFRLGYTQEDLNRINKQAIEQLSQLKQAYSDEIPCILISGCIGPAKSGYTLSERLTVEEAIKYHRPQILSFQEVGADLVSAFTLNYVEEAIGITMIAKEIGMEVVISFTLETDGRLIDGTPLEEAIKMVDEATESFPAYYMINCAHPSHFDHAVVNAVCRERVRAIRANASCKSHAELDESEVLDTGDREDLAIRHRHLQSSLPNLRVFGGCCGTSSLHVGAILETIK